VTDYKQKKILIVEDNIVNQELVKENFEKIGFQVVLANNGAEAVDEFDKDEFDVILMDLMMPVMDGVEATKQIRAKEEGKDKKVPIIALTANNVFENVKQICYKVGMDRYATKPMDMNEIIKYLKELEVIE
jgi:two-component system, sensor histidine kinase